jgi:hypothetical protein
MTLLPMADRLAEIRRIYFTTTRATIERDFGRALDLLKEMPSEDERSRATVFMHGLAQMRADWARTREGKEGAGRKRTGGGRPHAKR